MLFSKKLAQIMHLHLYQHKMSITLNMLFTMNPFELVTIGETRHNFCDFTSKKFKISGDWFIVNLLIR